MKQIIMKTYCLLLLTIISVALTACSDKTEYQSSIPAPQIKHLIIETGGNNIVVKQGTSSDITASIAGYDGDLLIAEGNTARLKIPMPKAGINFSTPAPLSISIPEDSLDSLTLLSEAGHIYLENITVAEVNATTEYGNIFVSGLSGTVSADTQMGNIISDSPLAAHIQEGKSYHGTMGDSEVKANITLSTNVGDIEFTK